MTFDYTEDNNLEGLVIKVASTNTEYEILKDNNRINKYILKNIQNREEYSGYSFNLIKEYIINNTWIIIKCPLRYEYSLDQLIDNFRKLL